MSTDAHNGGIIPMPTREEFNRALRELEHLNERLYDGEKLSKQERAVYQANVALVGRYTGWGHEHS